VELSNPINCLPDDLRETLLDILGLPELDTLTDDQTRGADCVWCADPLSIETAVDLGEVRFPMAGSTSLIGRLFPRACRTCAGTQAHNGLFTHCGSCEQCVDEVGRCPVGLWLYRLVREGRR
jgi:hypothetical protein